ncbi:putative phage tail assembly chaperone [Sodalis endosymbiont of Spalangia cameroni]|uniref:putative phage tail assembly chaperone n=1 Tax=Sodalis praecaptivus TaxID=1239307 RepID=UPI0031F95D17
MSKDNTASHIILTIKGQELAFAPNTTAYNSLINDMAMDNKIAPTVTYLRRIVVPESKAALDALLALPGAALQIAEAVNSQYAPKLEIEIKN